MQSDSNINIYFRTHHLIVRKLQLTFIKPRIGVRCSSILIKGILYKNDYIAYRKYLSTSRGIFEIAAFRSRLNPCFVRNWFLVDKGFSRGSVGVDKVFSRG